MFIASSLPMWRYESTLTELANDSRFSVYVVITPYLSYSSEERVMNIASLTQYFTQTNIEFNIANTAKEFLEIKRRFSPDIIFYPQPYNFIYPVGIDWRQNLDCLLCYLPYYVVTSSLTYEYDLNFHNALWRFYLQNDFHLRESRRIARNQGVNGVVVGDPRAEEFMQSSSRNPWLNIDDGIKRKRLIWAPHFQLVKNDMFNRPDFLWTAEFMVVMAKKYQDKLQIAFKPHPRLKSMLYELPEWGKDRTDEYYRLWNDMPNTQVEEGEYIDLFKTSDALIHNCGSFTGEYFYTGKPAAYISRDIENLKASLISFGQKCIDAHYIVSDENKIEQFIEEVVLKGRDVLRDTREKIYCELHTTPNNRTVGENIHEDLVKSLSL